MSCLALRIAAWILAAAAALFAPGAVAEEAPAPPAPVPEAPAEGEAEAEEPPPAPLDEATAALLEVLDKTHGKIRTLQAPYVQVRKVRISRRLRKAKGVMYVAKGEKPADLKVLFRETEPFASTALFTEKEVVFRDGETGRVRRYDPAEGGVKPSEIWVLGRPVAEIRRHYDPRRLALEAEEKEKYGAKLELTPRSGKIRKWVKVVLVWLRAGDALGLKVRIVDRTGDWQEFAFDEDDFEINPTLDPELFKVE